MSSNNTQSNENIEAASNSGNLEHISSPQSSVAASASQVAALSITDQSAADPQAILPSIPNALPPGGPTFHIFGQLPAELRAGVWHMAANQFPRLVHWRPGGGRPPAILLVNTQSRGIALQYYTLCFNLLRRSEFYALYINLNVDTVFRDQMLPNLIRTNAAPPYPVPQTTGVFRGVAGAGWNVRNWSFSVRRLCINIHEAGALAPTYHGTHVRRQTAWTKIRVMFPNMEELTIFIPRGLHLNTLEDLIELPVGFGSWRDFGRMANVTSNFSKFVRHPGMENVRLLFRTV